MNYTEPFLSLRSIVATRTRRIVVWCGAGLSAPAGIPAWGILQRRLETQLASKLESLDMPQNVKDAKLRAIRQERNPWVAFHRLSVELGATSFREGVRAALAPAASSQMPEAYELIWKIRPAGLLNLNLDRLATRALADSGEAKHLIEFKGKEIAPYSHVLSGPRQFICNLHGVDEDFESWIFTQPALKSLSATEAYKIFVSTVLLTSTVLFLGITADDMAVGGHLERLAGENISAAPHFWITDRRDVETDRWAEKVGVQVIRYSVGQNGHAELSDLLRELATYVEPEETEANPVTLALKLGSVELEPVEQLISKSPEHVRSVLNEQASRLLKKGEGEQAYEAFLKKYDRAIHLAWYTSIERDNNLFLGLRLLEEVARGAFGVVYRAVDSQGAERAVKVLHAEIRKNVDLLNAFRRGARSMRILEQQKVRGMASLVDATEIPATLIMEWIDGANLNQIVESGNLKEWDPLLDIAQQLASIVAEAHSLPERVIHRDIRPSNVMVCGFWENEQLDVRVLDFDLSWHRGSVERSVIFGSALAGYLAPEQLQRMRGVSTQHASVDSYGIGMTIFFLLSARNPRPGEHASETWEATVLDCAEKFCLSPWKSLPNRIARLILFSTQDLQEKRWDLHQMRSELERLLSALRSNQDVRSTELISEEICARCTLLDNYEWRDSDFSVLKDFGTGLVVSVRGDESSKQIHCTLTRQSMESDNRNKLRDHIHRAKENVTNAMKRAGWSAKGEVGHSMLMVSASVDSESAVGRIDKLAEGLRVAIEKMVFG